MSETTTYKGTLKVEKNYRPSFGDVFFAWVFFGLFRYWTYRFIIPWGIWGTFLYYFLLFSAISITARALFIPRYSYAFEREENNTDTTLETDKVEREETVLKEDSPQPKKSEVSPKLIESEKIPKLETALKVDKATENLTDSETKEEFAIDLPKIQPVKNHTGKNKAKNIEEETKFCSFCGVQHPEYARFCSACGEKLL